MTAQAPASPIEIDFDALPTLGAIPRHHAAHRGDRIALRFQGAETSWTELDARANRIANALIAAGCRHGDRVAYVGKGSDLFFELMLGAARAGVVLVPIQWRLAPAEIAGALADAEPRVVFLGADYAALTPPSATVMAIESDFAAWRDAAPDAPPAVQVAPRDIAIQLYTSGTTGAPKGVMLSHGNILGSRRPAAEARMPWNEWREGDQSLVAMPLGHIGGVGWGVVSLMHGVTTTVHRDFVPSAVLDAISTGGVSKIFLVPAAIQILLMQPGVRERDYSRLRHMLYGASPIALDLLREAAEVFGCGFCQQYGMTETTGTIVYLPPEDHVPEGNARMRGAGLPMPGVELRVVDPATRRVLPPGEIGEVETRSAANMAGYWRNPAATEDAVTGDGWLKTGDAGFLDADGYLTIHDRFKDMICTGAENVYPAEVESAIWGHPAVAEVAVIGVPDATWGEAVKAIVVLKPGAEADAAGIIGHARDKVAGFKLPKSVDFVATLPRNPSGKLLRGALREPYWAGRERGVN